MERLSPTGRLLEECREDIRAYLKAHPTPISTPDLIKAVSRTAEQQNKVRSSLTYGDSSDTFSTRREAYCAVLWSMRANGEVLTQNKTWLQCWYEHVPENDCHNWWGGNDY